MTASPGRPGRPASAASSATSGLTSIGCAGHPVGPARHRRPGRLEPARVERAQPGRTVSGEAGPGCVLERLELRLAVGLDDERALGQRERVEDELLELDRVRDDRLDPPARARRRTAPACSARWNGSRPPPPASRAANASVDEVQRDRAAPRARARRRPRARSASSSGRSEYSIISWRPSRTTTRPTFSAGSRLAHHLRRHLGAAAAMDAEEAGVADRDQRVVDLEVEDRADPALGHLGECAAPLERPDRAAVPVGRERDPAPLGEQDPAGHGGRRRASRPGRTAAGARRRTSRARRRTPPSRRGSAGSSSRTAAPRRRGAARAPPPSRRGSGTATGR